LETEPAVVDFPNRSVAFVKALLQYVYMDRLPTNMSYELTVDMLKEAGILRSDRLRTLAVSELIGKITRQNAAQVFKLGVSYRCRDLCEACRAFYKLNEIYVADDIREDMAAGEKDAETFFSSTVFEPPAKLLAKSAIGVASQKEKARAKLLSSDDDSTTASSTASGSGLHSDSEKDDEEDEESASVSGQESPAASDSGSHSNTPKKSSDDETESVSGRF
jgi:hypothetical protein